jgi:hypothetical protein
MKLAAEGGLPTRRGYPDLWFVRDGKLCFVEVKTLPGQALRPQQQRFLELAQAAGIPCFIYTPGNGFQELPKGG